MIEGLAGYTGFVGGNLFKKGNFNYLFNSKNIENLPNFSIDNLYFCAVGAEKWRINKEPKKDLEQINQQLNLLRKSKFERLILISTIDVYSRRDGINELCEETHYMNDISYGGNRRYFEKILLDEFKDVKIIRLPALFGDGLKKNIIFDLLQENMLKNINLNSTFQWYFLGNLFDDIAKVISLYPDQKVFNFFTEPIESIDIVERFFFDYIDICVGTVTNHYNIQTKFSPIPGNIYFSTKDEVLSDLSYWLRDFSIAPK